PLAPAASGAEDLDFTMIVPAAPKADAKAEEAAKQKAQEAAAAAARVKAEAEARARVESAARAKAAADAKAKAEAEARARADAEARAKQEARELARKEAEEKARREAEELRARLEEERKAREDAERERKEAAQKAQREAEELRAKLEEERKAREESERRAKEEERKAREDAQRRAQEEAERREQEELERRARVAAEREREEAAQKAQREAEELRAKLEEERKAREDAERRAQEEAERKAREDAQRRAREEVERREKEELERRARVAAERKRDEAAQKAQREAEELRAKLEEERKAREDAERRANEEAERREKEEAERKANEEAQRRAKEEAERREKEEAERKAREAERERQDAEARAREEAEKAERKARDAERERQEAEARAREEAEKAERKAREEAERRAKEEAERKAREAERERNEAEKAERKAREEAERRAKEEAERKAREAERERKEAEKAERKAREEAERRAKEEAERKAREAAERERKEAEARAEAERRAKEEAERKAKEAAERERLEAQESARRAAEEQPQSSARSGRSMDELTEIDTNFDAVSSPAWAVEPEAAPPRDDAGGGMLGESDARERRAAEEKAQREAQELARLRSEEEAKRAEEERERARKDEGALHPGLVPAAAGAPERELDYAEVRARLEAQEADETERHFAEMEKELEAEQAAGAGQIETREPARMRDPEEISMHVLATATAPAFKTQAEQAPAARVQRRQVKWGKPVAMALFLLLVLGLVVVHFVSFEGYIPRFEKLAGAYLQQPVKIRALHLSLVPQPHWRLNGVSVGNEGQLKVEAVKANAGPGNMFGDTMAFSSIELDSPVLSEQGMAGLLFGKPAGQDFRVANIIVKNGKLESKSFVVPALDARISMAESGAWQKIALETPDHKTSLLLVPEGEGAQLEVDTNVFSLPFDPSFLLENFSAKGVIRRGELRLSELKGGIYGGFLTGSAHLKWDADWSMSGEVSVRAMAPGKFAPALFEEGALEGKAVYAMRAKSFDELFAAPRLEGNFEIRKGALLGVDLGRLLQGGGVGGKTTYTELTGTFVREAGKTQLRQVHLSAGPVRAAGNLDASADSAKHLNGRFVVDLKSPVVQAHSNLTLTGTLRDPRFSR
ncbi:MAG: AsmA family protein, partial [Burkholderiales bacterium]|nr:AsmA family protein [Burkholderiales bacterium]